MKAQRISPLRTSPKVLLRIGGAAQERHPRLDYPPRVFLDQNLIRCKASRIHAGLGGRSAIGGLGPDAHRMHARRQVGEYAGRGGGFEFVGVADQGAHDALAGGDIVDAELEAHAIAGEGKKGKAWKNIMGAGYATISVMRINCLGWPTAYPLVQPDPHRS